MRENKLHTPQGVKDYLPEAYALKKKIEQNIGAVFGSHGYLGIESPTLEYIEVFEGTGSIKPKEMYKFIDRDGEILVLRPDLTPAIARIVATNYTQSPLRFYYTGNTFRYNETYQGKLRESTQAGIELIGVNSHDADAEVINIAITSLISTGLKDFRIDIGQVQFLKGVLEEAGLSSEDSLDIQKDILRKDYVSVEEKISKKNVPADIKKLLARLPMQIGSIEILEEVKGLVKNKISLDALESLLSLYERLKDYGVNDYICFDLSMTGHLDYYTGIIFSGYALGTGSSILEGGRYDNLISLFNQEDLPSIGFGIKINNLLSIIQTQRPQQPQAKTRTLLAYTDKDRKEAYAVGAELRGQGMTIETSFQGADLMDNIAYAKSRDISGIIYFAGDGNITMYNVATDQRQDITIEQLLKGE